jgi:tripartite-type tricarboxylate transporter receptor subunit TctC
MKTRVILYVGIVLLGGFSIFVEKSFSQESFPVKPITLVVGFAPGGVTDIVARALAPAASKYLGQPVVVVNKPGAAGTLGIDYLINSKPDGYTLIHQGLVSLAYGSHTMGVSWGPNDFTLLIGHSIYNFAAVVRSDAPWKNFDEWVEYVRQNPGFKYGVFGALSTPHIIMEWIGKRLGLKLVAVHFSGGDPQGISNLLGGHIQLHCAGGGHAAQVKAGKLRSLLQFIGEPIDSDPKTVARLKEVFPDSPLEIVGLPAGEFGPKGIPASVQGKLHDAFYKATIENPEFIKTSKLMNLGVEYHNPKELQETLTKAHENYGKLIKSLGLERK